MLFRLNPDGSNYGVVFSFLSTATVGGRPDYSRVVEKSGWLYGVCLEGGANNAGVVYRVSLDGTTYENVRQFSAGNLDIARPVEINLGADGFFYGNALGGSSGGAIFRLGVE